MTLYINSGHLRFSDGTCQTTAASGGSSSTLGVGSLGVGIYVSGTCVSWRCHSCTLGGFCTCRLMNGCTASGSCLVFVATAGKPCFKPTPYRNILDAEFLGNYYAWLDDCMREVCIGVRGSGTWMSVAQISAPCCCVPSEGPTFLVWGAALWQRIC